MQDTTTTTPPAFNCNRFDWFALFIDYLKFRTFVVYSAEVPGITELELERIWPTMLDYMLGTVTKQAAERLAKEVPLCQN